MSEHEPRAQRPLREMWPSSHSNDNTRSQLVGERQILELISMGAPTPTILNRLCAAVDVQIGDVVSLVFLPNGEENDLWSITQSAAQVGLNVFSTTNILAHDKTLLGTLEIYSCDPRRPTPNECHLIARVIHLAAIALQCREEKEDFKRPSRPSRGGIDDELERPRFIN